MSPVALLGFSLIGTTFLFILFLIERRRGVRFFPRVRMVMDRALEERLTRIRERIPAVNSAFFRHLYHYAIHRILARLLSVVRIMERGITAIAHRNRKKAKERLKSERGEVDTHLKALAEHKEVTALSSVEKEARKRAAIGETEDALNTLDTNLRRRQKK